MPSLSALSALAAFALSSVSEARPIPAIVNANEGVLTIQNANEPKGYDSEHLEPYDHYHFRYTAIGCPDFEKNATFFETCCHPRKSDAQSDSKYPAACNLESYLIFNPQYKDNKVVAQLGSLAKADSDEADAGVASDKKANSAKEGSSDTKKGSSSSSDQAPSSTWTPKSSSQAWIPEAAPSTSSSKKDTFTPEAKAAAVAPSSKWTPTSSSSEWTPAWTPSSSSQAPQWTSSSEPAPAPAATQETHDSGNNDNKNGNNNNGGGGGDYTGTASWFTQNGNAGACGIYHSDSDHIVALQQDLYGNLGQQSQYCGRSLTITNTATGATAQAVVADACPGCSSYYSLDLSTGLFQALGNLDQGLLPIKWHFN